MNRVNARALCHCTYLSRQSQLVAIIRVSRAARSGTTSPTSPPPRGNIQHAQVGGGGACRGPGAHRSAPQRPAASAQRDAATAGCRRRPGAHAVGAEHVARGGVRGQRLPRLAQGHAAAIGLAAGARACRARAIGAIGAERAARGAAHRRWQSRWCPTVH